MDSKPSQTPVLWAAKEIPTIRREMSLIKIKGK